MTIKRGTLVKAWEYSPSCFIITIYDRKGSCKGHYTSGGWYENVIEIPLELIPQELANSLEELGNE